MEKHKRPNPKRTTLIKRWSQLKVTERVAILTVIGTLMSALIGGLCAILAGFVPVAYQRLPSTNLRALKVADFRFDDWRTGSVYGIPFGSSPPVFSPDQSWGIRREFLNSQGYHILYENGDFTALAPHLSPSVVPTSSIEPAKPLPVVPMEYELWNIDKEFQVVIDEIALELISYESPVASPLEMYYLVGPEVGGGPDLPRRAFDVSLSPSSKVVNLFRKPSTRILLGPGDVLLVIVNVTFQSPGRFRFRTSIHYHLPDGSSNTLTFEELTYSWVKMDFVDGSQLKVIR